MVTLSGLRPLRGHFAGPTRSDETEAHRHMSSWTRTGCAAVRAKGISSICTLVTLCNPNKRTDTWVPSSRSHLRWLRRFEGGDLLLQLHRSALCRAACSYGRGLVALQSRPLLLHSLSLDTQLPSLHAEIVMIFQICSSLARHTGLSRVPSVALTVWDGEAVERSKR